MHKARDLTRPGQGPANYFLSKIIAEWWMVGGINSWMLDDGLMDGGLWMMDDG